MSQRHVVSTKIRQFTNKSTLDYLGDMQELGLPEYTNNSKQQRNVWKPVMKKKIKKDYL